MRSVDAISMLLRNIVTKDYRNSKIINQFIFCNRSHRRTIEVLRHYSRNEKFIRSFIYKHNLRFARAEKTNTMFLKSAKR